MTKMKILLDGSSAIVGARAVKRYTLALIREFLSLNKNDEFKILLNYFKGNSEVIDSLFREKSNFSTIRIPLPRRFSLPFWNWFSFPSIELITGKIDIFHSLGDDCPPLKSPKYIITLHGVTYLEVPELMDPNYVRAKKAWLCKMTKRANYFISVSEYTKNIFLTHFPYVDPNRIKVVPLGVDERFRIVDKNMAKERVLEKFKIEEPYILFVGGIEPRKNVKNIIKGFHEISDKYPELRLLLVGMAEDAYLSSLKIMIIKLGLDKRIKFLGYVKQGTDDLTMLYNGAEFFVYPSFSEGWTSPPLEAMACGIPVIVSNLSSLPETVGDAALFVNPEDFNEIGSALERLIVDSDLRENLIKKGLHHASRFTWKLCAEETYSFYKKIVESGQMV